MLRELFWPHRLPTAVRRWLRSQRVETSTEAMARIRSIKPEFPQSETVGKLSRDARLLFIQLWTLVDDEGRTRAASRMLASLLYPYDEDAPGLIEGWLAELERNDCIVRYVVEGSTYLQVNNWLKHQKIDHPGRSKLPVVREGSRIFANGSETLAPDLGPRIKDQGKDLGSERKNAAADEASRGLAKARETDQGPAPVGAHSGQLELAEPSRSPPAPPDAETELFRRGREVLGKSAGGLITQLLKAKDGKVALARAAIETASTKSDPREYIGAIIRGKPDEEPYRVII